MKDWIILVLACVVGYILLYSMIEYQRNDVSSQIDKYFERQGEAKPFFKVIEEVHGPAEYSIQTFIAMTILVVLGKYVIENTFVRAILYSAPCLFIVQIVLLEYTVSNTFILVGSYLITIALTFIFSKHQEIFAGVCTGFAGAYFMYYMMTFDTLKQNKTVGVTNLFPMYLAIGLYNVAITIFAKDKLNKNEWVVYKRYLLIQIIVYCMSVMWLGYYNVHLSIAGEKISKHQYESHIEHLVVYYGCHMSFIVGGSLLINSFVWVQYSKLKPYFLWGHPETLTDLKAAPSPVTPSE